MAERSNLQRFKVWAKRAVIVAAVAAPLGGLVGLVGARIDRRAKDAHTASVRESVARAAENAEHQARELTVEREDLEREASAPVEVVVDGKIPYYAHEPENRSVPGPRVDLRKQEEAARDRARRARLEAEKVRKREQEARDKANRAVLEWEKVRRLPASSFFEDARVTVIAFALKGALFLGAFPAAVAAWFLLLHRVGKEARAERGQDE